MARLGTDPLFRYYNTDGSVLKGGKVYTYESGASTTVKPTYHDAKRTIRHENPIILDSMGEAAIYMLSDGEYRFVVKDSNDVTLGTIDNINGVEGFNTLSQPLDVNGMSIVSSSNGVINVTPSGTGSVILDGLTWVKEDGASSQILKTLGTGKLGWTYNATIWSDDGTPQLGGNLDTNTYNIKVDNGRGIKDDSGNEHILFNRTVSAVNYIDITNSATGNNVSLSAAGSDTNIDFNLNPKGTSVVTINGFTFPTSDGLNGQFLLTDGNQGFYWGTPSFVASQAQMESGTSSGVLVAPSVIKYGRGIAKAWSKATYTGSTGPGIASFVDETSTVITLNWDDSFTAYYAAVCSAGSGYSTNDAVWVANCRWRGATYTTFQTRSYNGGLSGEGQGFGPFFYIQAYGDLA